jgi:anti-anti-sigma factor
MATQVLETDVRQRDGMVVIDLRGEIDAFGEAALNSAYAQAKTLNASNILLNFKDVNYINSTGIALIVGLIAQSRKAGQKLLVCGLSDHYREIFEVTRLSDFMTIYPDETTALKRE